LSLKHTVLFIFITFTTPDNGEANNLKRKRLAVEVIISNGTVQKCTDFSGW
jgi:hypothetical protein